jgi:hypothetical protein
MLFAVKITRASCVTAPAFKSERTMEWQPIDSAPGATRLLVSDPAGLVIIARRVGQAWTDDAGRRLVMEPHAWMPLPEPHLAGDDVPIFLS